MPNTIKGQRLTNRQSVDMLAVDPLDIPVIPPLRIKLESTGDKSKLIRWLSDIDNEMIVKMHAGDDIVRGLVGDDLSDILEETE